MESGEKTSSPQDLCGKPGLNILGKELKEEIAGSLEQEELERYHKPLII